MGNILKKIFDKKRQRFSEDFSVSDQREAERLADEADLPRPFLKALQSRAAIGDYGLIAEMKKASPSKGELRAFFDPSEIARAYERGGAACLSVLTDVEFFAGAPNHLVAARSAVTLPVMRKDFLFHPHQAIEARALGADCILLILAAISDHEARELRDAASAYSMDILVEVHDEAELKRALTLDTGFIGINNRNLSTFEADLSVSERLTPLIPPDWTVVSESGISSAADLRRLVRSGINSFLIGEALMRHPDLESATRKLLYG